MAILLRRFDLALDNWWMYNSAFSERTPFGRAGQGLQEVVVDVLHCLVVRDTTANGGRSFKTKTWTIAKYYVGSNISLYVFQSLVLGK